LPETERPADITLDNDLRMIRSVVEEAGALAMEFFQQDYEAWEKSPGNPVTEADLAVDDLIKRRLTAMRPGYGWLSEETADDLSRLSCDRLWLVDPIDGTRAFLKGKDGFSVSIALVEHGEPVLAAVTAPARGLVFEARKGAGAWLNGQRIQVSDRADLHDCVMSADAQMFGWRGWPRPWPPMRFDKPNSIALRLALVACGEADAAIAMQPKSEWDMAAACLILSEAGGLYTDHLGARPRFNKPQPLLTSVVAANPALQPDLVRRVAEGIAAWEATRGTMEKGGQ
jgi:myo-inositol-1(or 4)-monophosphatase